MMQMSPPRTLDELLGDFASVRPDADLDTVIAANPWAQRFKDFLDKRNLKGKVIALKFLILTQPLEAQSHSATNSRLLFVRAGALFFAEDSAMQLSLSNEVLFEEVSASTSRARRNPAARLTSQDLENMLEARRDVNVRLNGLDKKFSRFLAQQTELPSPVACLLSIL